MSWSFNDIMRAMNEFRKEHNNEMPKYLIVKESDWAAWPHKGMTEIYNVKVIRMQHVPFTGFYKEMPV